MNTSCQTSAAADGVETATEDLSLVHISEPTRLLSSSYAGFCLKKKNTFALHQ